MDLTLSVLVCLIGVLIIIVPELRETRKLRKTKMTMYRVPSSEEITEREKTYFRNLPYSSSD